MALIHPLVQEYKLGLGVSPSTTSFPSTRYSDHLANEVDSLSSPCTNWGLVSVHQQPICPQQDTLTIWLMKSTLSAPLGRTLYLLSPVASDMHLLPLSMLQVHLAIESRLSIRSLVVP